MHPDNVYEYQLYFGSLLDKPYFHTYCKEEKEEKMEENRKFYLSVAFDDESELMILRIHTEPCFKHSTSQYVYEPDKIYPDGDTEDFVDCINLLVKQIWLFLTTSTVFLDEDGDPVVDYSKISEFAYRVAVDFFQDMDEPVMWDITDIENPEKLDDICEYCDDCDNNKNEEDEEDCEKLSEISEKVNGLEKYQIDILSRLEHVETKTDRHESEISAVLRQMTEMQKQINTALDVVMLHLNN